MITGKGAIMHQARATAAAKAKGQAARVMLEFLGRYLPRTDSRVLPQRLDYLTNAVRDAVSFNTIALISTARAIRDGVLCVHFVLYMTVLCVFALALGNVYNLAAAMLTDEVSARYVIFCLGLLPGLFVCLCPSLTRFSVRVWQQRVQLTWDALIDGTDHLIRRNAHDGGRQARGRRFEERHFEIHRPPVVNKFWMLVMISLAILQYWSFECWRNGVSWNGIHQCQHCKDY
jgi:hypothetical protein